MLRHIEKSCSYKLVIENLIYERQWCEIIEDELSNLWLYAVKLIESLLNEWKAVECKWVFKIKYDEKEWVVKFKARLVIQSFLQIYRVTTLRCLLLWCAGSC